jgi:hypothetical protein
MPRVSPAIIRLLKAETGRTMTDLMGSDAETGDDGDRFQLMIWLELRRQGIAATWDQCEHVEIEFVVDEPDPTNGARAMSSPPSVDTGA